jgi:hypothetical protein
VAEEWKPKFESAMKEHYEQEKELYKKMVTRKDQV